MRQQRVAAAGDQTQKGRIKGLQTGVSRPGDRGVDQQKVRRNMPLQVIDGGEGQAPRGRQAFGGGQANE